MKTLEGQHPGTDAELGQQLGLADHDSRQTYGSPRLLQALQKKGLRTSRRRVRRLMRQHELRGIQPRAFRPQTTDRRHDQPIAPNLMAAAPTPTGPNQIWVRDLTYVRTDTGWSRAGGMAAVLDRWSRRLLGLAMAEHMETFGGINHCVSLHLPLAPFHVLLRERPRFCLRSIAGNGDAN